MKARFLAVMCGLRSGDWLTEKRARAYGWMLAAMLLIQGLNLSLRILRSALADPHLRPEPTDFDAFWSGAYLAVHGHAALAYDFSAIKVAEAVGAQQAAGMFLPYLYPPSFLLVTLPLGLLPYLPAMAIFALGGFGLFALCIRQILPRSWPTLTILAFPAAMMNATMGQTGFLSASCFAGAMLWLERRPALAGACLGALAFKPHLAVCGPVALLAARRWTALAACVAMACGIALLSLAILGRASWSGFLGATPAIRAILEAGDIWPKLLLSTFAAARLLGAGLPAAYAVQLVISTAALACLVCMTRGRPGAHAEMAVTVSAALMCTPYLLDYDLVCLAVPLAWLAGRGAATGWRPWEKTVLLVACIVPLEARNLNLLHLPVAALMLPVLLASVLARAYVGAPAGRRVALVPLAG